MSQENVEAARRTFEALGRGDFQAAALGFHADATWHNTREFVGEPICVGAQAIVDFWRTLLFSFEEDGTTRVEQVADGEDTVVLGVHATGRRLSSSLKTGLALTRSGVSSQSPGSNGTASFSR